MLMFGVIRLFMEEHSRLKFAILALLAADLASSLSRSHNGSSAQRSAGSLPRWSLDVRIALGDILGR